MEENWKVKDEVKVYNNEEKVCKCYGDEAKKYANMIARTMNLGEYSFVMLIVLKELEAELGDKIRRMEKELFKIGGKS